MQKTTTERPEIHLVGIKVRTNNQLEQDPQLGRIGPCVQKYFHQQLFEKIPHRKNPGTTLCAYTDYESDHTGDYTYFIGEEVTTPGEMPEGLEKMTIPSQTYAKFTTNSGPMPNVLINAWQEVWEMGPSDLGGKRRYQTDFELYDQRASDHSNVVLDLYIGIAT